MVVTVGLCVVDEPVPIATDPPHEPEYQYQFAPEPKEPPVIPRVVAKPLQIGETDVADVAAVE